MNCTMLVHVPFIECHHVNIARDHEIACSEKYARFTQLQIGSGRECVAVVCGTVA
jgi:hypothetical protein